MAEKVARPERFYKRLETEFYFKDRTFRGISSNVSENGIFIRTRNSLTEGSPITAKIYLPNSKTATLKGEVMRYVKTDSTLVKNGMGISLKECDSGYLELIKDVGGELTSCSCKPPLDGGDAKAEEDLFRIIACPECKVKNKVRTSKLSLGPKCGKCKAPLPVAD